MEPKLFVAIYSDEDVTPKLARELRRRGYEAQSYLDVDMLDIDDDAHFAYAIRHQSALLTNNGKHFTVLANDLLARGEHHYGVIVATHQMSLSELLRRTLALLDTIAADDAIGRTFYLSNFG
jgi:hypothetical protein